MVIRLAYHQQWVFWWQVSYTGVIDACVKEVKGGAQFVLFFILLYAIVLFQLCKGKLGLASSYFQRMMDEGQLKATTSSMLKI